MEKSRQRQPVPCRGAGLGATVGVVGWGGVWQPLQAPGAELLQGRAPSTIRSRERVFSSPISSDISRTAFHGES